MQVSLEGVSVFVAMPAHRGVPVQTVLSLVSTVAACIASEIPIQVGMPNNGAAVTSARNGAAAAFLKTDMSHCFWIDSDMEWDVEDFFTVLGLAVQADIGTVCYPKKREPIVFNKEGLGFTCCKRSVLEALEERAPMLSYGEGWTMPRIFREGTTADEFVPEDAMFFEDARALGFKILVAPSIDLGHVGDKVYRGKLQDIILP